MVGMRVSMRCSHHRRHNVCATGRSVVDEAGADADAAAYSAEHDAHHAVRDERMAYAHEEVLEDTEAEGNHRGAVDGAEHERATHYLVGHGEQQQVACVGGHGHRYGSVRGEIHQRADTRKSSHHHLVRKDAGSEADCVNHQSHRDHHIVLSIYQQIVVFVFL